MSKTLNNKVQYLRQNIFNYPIIEEIDEDLILLSIIAPSQYVNKNVSKKLIQKFKTSNNDQLELLGDAVLELIITDMLIDKGIIKTGELSRIRSAIVRNISLICLMNDRHLCDLTKNVTKSCADIFESLVGALYTHLSQYNVNPIKIMTQWMSDVWRMDFIVNYMIQHPKEENICQAIQHSYADLLNFSQPYFGYIQDPYQRLIKIYEYYQLGPVEMLQQQNKGIWTIKIVCPLTLGCQYYADKQGDKRFLGVYSHPDKVIAIAEASKQAIDFILNDYDLL
jgi:dsRNA-specific ribonuclease